MAKSPLTHLLRRYSSKRSLSQIRVFICNPLYSISPRYNHNHSYNFSSYRYSSSSKNSLFSSNPSSPLLLNSNYYAKCLCTSVESGESNADCIVDNGVTENLETLVDNEVDNVPDFDVDLCSEGPCLVRNENDLSATVTSVDDLELESLPVVDGEAGSSRNCEGFEHVASRDPVEIYNQLQELPRDARLCKEDWQMLHEIFGRLARSPWASNQALAIFIGKSFFPTAVHKFRSFFTMHCRDDVAKYLLSLGPSDEAERFLFPIFVEFCLEEFPSEIKRYRKVVESADLTKPHTWFPFARAMKRKIIYHCGPTNSGKTYNALQRFMEAKKGIYCSPLRLLAMEVFDKVNTLGVYCSLLTGQEKKYVPFANHVACTVEMVSTNQLYDVAVIDEIQMMADSSRGFAWTRALLGLNADEIHLCGDPSVLNIVRKICSDTGDELVEQHYDRFKPLVVESKTLQGDFRNIKSGDCVVAFSRREIFEVKLTIEKQTKHRCCVIYGALPPETRRQQASLFNDPDNEYDVLVASDAVGMGLNLNIRRVVFYSLSKYNGDKILPVPGSQVKQIAGRAGRRGSRYPDGLTTTFLLEDLDYLIECLKQPFEEVTKVGLFPFYEQVELFAGQIPNTTFADLLEKFAESCRLDGSYFLCQLSNIRKVANMLEKVQGLSLEDRYNFCFAPVNIRDPKAMYHLLRFASSYSHKLPVNIAMGIPKGSARNDTELLDLETKHQVCSMYMWLSNHFKAESFPYRQRAESMASNIAELLGESLGKASWKPESRVVGKKKPEEKKKGYERPQSIIKVFDKKRQEKSSKQDKSGKSSNVAGLLARI
ncbi:DExH-box ATP-dependent RNA helicase DExH18, mitochondrial isoform X2 [Silene latifolia]|uniref:DExH-box ATP-dependent RNA helicase DExH18, mitochondrial isoform X2 n=1 Tax=Silene latifolia TaxID=37657 RepID=UPI003D76ABD2